MDAAVNASPNLRCARDATRGGLASALNENAEASHIGIELDEDKVSLRDEVKGVCEILGLDPLYIANEGALVVFCPPDETEALLAAMQGTAVGKNSVRF